jgi:hypothetical protein
VPLIVFAEPLLLAALSAAYYFIIIAPYRTGAKQQRDAPIGERVLVIARRLVFVVLYTLAIEHVMTPLFTPDFQRGAHFGALEPLLRYEPTNRMLMIAAGVAAIEIVWGPPSEAEWARATRTGLRVCKFTLLGAVLLLILSSIYFALARGG